MSTVVFVILIFISLAVKVFSKVVVHLHQKVILTDGNPKKLKDCYIDICNQIQYEDISDFNPEINKVLFTEVIKELEEASIYCLIVLSLFSNAISEYTLQKITGLEKKQLSILPNK